MNRFAASALSLRKGLVLLSVFGWTGGSLLQAAPAVHWKLDETSGTSALDSGANGVNGVWSGTGASAGWVPDGGVDGGAVSFTGVTGANDFFTAPLTLVTDDPVSLSVWVKTASTQNDGLVFLGDGTATASYKVLRVELNLARLGIRAGGNETKINGPAAINDNAWHHLVGVFTNGSQRQLYIDGRSVAAGTAAFGAIPMNRLGIGALTRSVAADLYTGLLDDVSLWTEPLTAQQVAALHAMGVARGGNASDLERFLTAFASRSNVTTGPRCWTFASGLTGPVGSLSGSLVDGNLAVVLDEGAGSGMKITTAVAAPVIGSFSAEPSTITSGESSLLSWSITNAVSAKIDPGNISVAATSGTLSVSPGISRTYTLTAVNPNGSTDRSTLVTVNVPRRLKLHWALDETTGTAAASSTGSFGGTMVGTPPPLWTTPGRMGGSLAFADTDGVAVRASAALVEGYPFSLGAWVRTTGTGTDTLASLGTGVDDQYHALKIVNGVTRLTARNGALVFDLNGATVNDGSWHFVAGVFVSPQVRRLYVDGIQSATVSNDSHGILPPDRFAIGGLDTSSTSITEGFSGELDDASFWQGVLSAADVACLHGAAAGLGLNAGEVSSLLLAFGQSAKVTVRGSEWSPASGLAGTPGQTSGSLAGGNASLVMDPAGGGMRITAVAEDFRIASVVFAPAGRSVTLTFPSESGRNYRIEASPDLTTWTPLALSLPGLAGTTPFTESNLKTGVKILFFGYFRGKIEG